MQVIAFIQGLMQQKTWLHFGVFAAYTVTVFLMRFILRRFIRRWEHSHPGVTIGGILYSGLNWLTFYTILIFVVVYFANSNWMTSRIIAIGKVAISPSVIFIAVLIITFANRFARWIKRSVLPNIYERYQLDSGMRYTLDRVIHYSIVLASVLVSLNTVGINLSALTVFAGVIGVGIGFGMQNIASNFISGLIILFEHPIKIGDRVIIQNVIGDVERINMRATVVKTLEGEHIIIPNSYFLQEQVVNRSYGDLTLRLTINVGVAYSSDVEDVRTALLRIADEERKQSPEILNQPAPFVNFLDYGNSSLDFQLFVWISDPTAQIRVSSNLRFRIWHELSRLGIEMPFPQRDLHIRSLSNEVIDAIRHSN
jgi:small-conductance mechanosensitive channel